MKEDDNNKQADDPGAAIAGNIATSSPGESTPDPRQNHPTTTKSYGMTPVIESGPSRGGAGRSALISELVAQLKRGEITKTDLFARLQQLQGAGVTGMGDAAGAASATAQSPASSTNALPSTSGSLHVAGVGAGRDGDASLVSSGGKEEAADPGEEEAAGFFSANDRQAIIKKIADERRRRAQDIRQSWSEGGPTDPAQPQPSSSTEVSTSGGIQSDPLAVYSSTSQSSLQQQKHHNASLSNAPTPSSTGVQSSSNSFRDSGNRRTAWEQNNVPESPLGNYETPSNKFPFPTNNGRGGDGRRVDSADRDNLASSTPSSRDVGGGGSRRDGTRWTAELATRTPSHATGRGGIGGVTGGGGGGGDNGDRYHPTPSSNRLASVGDTNTGEEEAAGGRYGDRRRGQGKSNPGGLPTRKSAIDPTIGAGTTRTSRVASPLSRGQHHGSGAVPPEDVLGSPWTEGNEDTWGGAGRGGGGQQQQQQRKEWDGGGGAGRGGGEQANERTVDEDAYRFRSFSEERARRGEELVRRELMNECTFTPKIKGLPQSYGATNHDETPFLQRVSQWQREKEKDAAARKVDGEEKELEACTFTPHVNKVSRRAAILRREALGEKHLAVDDRLYDESLRRDMDRSHLTAEQALKEEERHHEECTFTPELATQRAAASAGDCDGNGFGGGYTAPRGRSRYRQAAKAVAAAVATGGVGGGGSSVWGAGRRANWVGGRNELEACTFSPAVIGARKGMNQAQQYLQYDVVERLTGAAFRSPEGTENEDGVGDDSEEGEALFGYVRGVGGGVAMRAQPNGQGSSAWANTAAGGDKTVFDSTGGAFRRPGSGGSDASASFHAFLSRQNKMETDKRRHIEAIQAMSSHPFRPAICPESAKIHSESNKGSFLQRVARDAARKEHEAGRQQAAGMHDPDCTFKPQITARSATLQGRSVMELSRGDQLKRETTKRLTRLRAEQELLVDTTFRPRINAVSRMAVSKLKVLSDPGNYIATVESLRRLKEQSVVKGALERAAKEVEECTFAPKTTECPAYISRIAHSISASKAAAGKQKTRVKPDWR